MKHRIDATESKTFHNFEKNADSLLHIMWLTSSSINNVFYFYNVFSIFCQYNINGNYSLSYFFLQFKLS